MEQGEHIIISLGGSLIVPDEIDTGFLKNFTTLIKEFVGKNFKFIIITGGGKVCRRYNEALETVTVPSKTDLDWLGIAATRLNAEFVRIGFGELAHNAIIMDPDAIPASDSPILVGGGWKPGNSSDLAAVHAAKSSGAKTVINLSNIDYAYDKDPKQFPDAKKLEQVSWADYRTYIPAEWKPGLNSPFDPIAAKQAERLGLKVVIMGKSIENLRNYLDGKDFIGTVIQ